MRRAPTLACFAPAALRFACAAALSGASVRDVFRTPNGVFVSELNWLITTGLALGAATDVLIAACMIFYLARMFSMYNLRSYVPHFSVLISSDGWYIRTTAMLNRLVRMSLRRLCA